MKTKIIFVLTLSWLTGIALHAAPLTVAVYDFTGDADAASYGKSVTTLVTANLTTETNLVMLERAELNKALNEQAFGISGLVSSDAAAKIGQITGAKILVTGQVIKTGDNHLVIVASIIGTETGRLFADKVEGGTDSLEDLTTTLSRKIAQTIGEQGTNLIAVPEESRDKILANILQGIQGTNRPTVSVSIMYYGENVHWRDDWVEHEFGTVLLKAGFTVLDEKSDRKAEVEITGNTSTSDGPKRGELVTSISALEIKVQDRRSGRIIILDRQENQATGIGHAIVMRISTIKTVDALCQRILPLLAATPVEK